MRYLNIQLFTKAYIDAEVVVWHAQPPSCGRGPLDRYDGT